MTHLSRKSKIQNLKSKIPRPTARSVTFLVTALLLYFFANQTQVGWLYVMSALLVGIVLASGWLNRRALRGIQVERQVGDDPAAELYEGERVAIGLTIRNADRAAKAHVRAVERCPLAAPGSPEREMNLFAPVLPAGGSTRFDYEVEIDRRGLHEFLPLELTSRAPFGFFRRRRYVAAPTRVLVYPEVRLLSQLSLLDQRQALETAHVRAGVGAEVLGVRPFRSGDSARQIHWRSVARTGHLISKEFAAETKPGLALVIDLYAHPYLPTGSKHTSFEWAVKAAASVGDYAQRRGYPLYLLADDSAWPTPTGPLTRWALLEYLARVQPTGVQPLADVLERDDLLACPCVAIILPWPDSTAVEALANLHQQEQAILVLLVDPASFPDGGPSAISLADEVQMAGLETRLLRFGEDWREQLCECTNGRTYESTNDDPPIRSFAHSLIR